MSSIESRVCGCPRCGMRTVQHRNVHKMSTGMCIVHLGAVVITGGLWLIYLIPATMIRSLMTGKWACSQCGN